MTSELERNELTLPGGLLAGSAKQGIVALLPGGPLRCDADYFASLLDDTIPQAAKRPAADDDEDEDGCDDDELSRARPAHDRAPDAGRALRDSR